MICEICSSPMEKGDERLFALPTVTSDCRPWSAGRGVEICTGCGVMKRVTHRLAQKYFDSIYEDYKNYPEPTGRTAKILEFVKNKIPDPKSVLDIGSGDGSGVITLGNFFPKAEIYGYEPRIVDSRWVDRKFDLITLFHVLEHVEDIHEMLEYVKSSLTKNGHILIQVPYAIMWPFDLVLADHIWHFNVIALRILFEKFGFDIINNDNNVIKKEITLLAISNEKNHRPEYFIRDKIVESIKEETINWLMNYKIFLDNINDSVAVYGTGPAAAWAGNILDDKVVFYIDDDESRWGHFNGRNVFSTSTILPIVAPFPDWQWIQIKMKNPGLRFL